MVMAMAMMMVMEMAMAPLNIDVAFFTVYGLGFIDGV